MREETLVEIWDASHLVEVRAETIGTLVADAQETSKVVREHGVDRMDREDVSEIMILLVSFLFN